MGMAEKQTLPERPTEKASWVFTKLFPLAGVIKSVTKTFINPFEILFGLSIVLLIIGELLGRNISWKAYLLVMLLVILSFTERQINFILSAKKSDKK